MKRLTTALMLILASMPCLQALAQATSVLPLWERKSAPAVILGRYTDWKPGDDIYAPAYWGNKHSLKESRFPEKAIDSIGGFTMVWDICYPILQGFHGFSILLCPGDTVRLDINKKALEEYNSFNGNKNMPTAQALWKKAIHIEGGTMEQPSPVKIDAFEPVGMEFTKAHLHDNIDKWQGMCWAEFQKAIQQLKALHLSPAQQEWYTLLSEMAYIDRLKDFFNEKTTWADFFEQEQFKYYVAEHHLVRDSFCITDKDELEAFRQQMTLKDPHVADLNFYRGLQGANVCHDTDYLEANGLMTSPLGRWLTEVKAAKAVMNRVKACLPVNEGEISALAPEFQAQIREVQAQLAASTPSNEGNEGARYTLPEGAPQEWLPKIVAQHKGKIVFIDFWATWCGPCLTGMKEMESVKPELRERGVDFVYITDTSSDTKRWTAYVKQHAGHHYIVPKEQMDDMQIPKYYGAIPHYLIYDRKGRLVKAISGWSDVESMKEELDKVQ